MSASPKWVEASLGRLEGRMSTVDIRMPARPAAFSAGASSPAVAFHS